MGYNFHINTTLGFNKSVTEDHPYQRQTAPFRKDQFDTGTSAGDQSLTGWWTRGQLSFHRGAGVKYYEVSEGDGVLNRYDDSSSVDVFTPGQVSLLPALVDMSVAARDVVPGLLVNGGGAFALTGTDVKFVGLTGTVPIPTTDGNPPGAITSSGGLVFVTNGNKIEVQSDPSATKYNLVKAPSCELATGTGANVLDGWTVYGSPNPQYGTASGQFPAPPAGGGAKAGRADANAHVGEVGACAEVTGLTIGLSYFVTVDVQYPSGVRAGVTVQMQTGDASSPGGHHDGTWADSTAAAQNAWQTLTFTRVAVAATEYLHVRSSSPSTNAYTQIMWDKAMVVEAPYPGAYFDGSTRGGSWSGTPNNSVSTFATVGAGSAFATLATLSAGSWVGVWWGKGRLWAVDDAGSWYAIPVDTLGVNVTRATDAFWKSGQTTAKWSFTDSPGSVYLSNGFDVYAVSVATDGTVPVLGTPTTASQVPLGESITCMAFYLTYLILATTSGVRIVLVQGNQSAMSGLIVKGDFTATKRIGLHDTNAYACGRLDGRGGDTVLCAINLADNVTDLQPAWAPLWTVTGSSSDSSGCVLDPFGTFYVWAAGKLYETGADPAAVGTLTTGYHRFGTLDPKLFYSVLVRADGTGGTIKVERVDGDGAATVLGTVNSGDDAVLGMGMPDPAERVALRFTLTAAGSTGPTLLGYQLKALPSPVRQRLLQVPLMLFDHERPAVGRATGGAAWDRLSTLEALEQSNAMVSFEDDDTGESGTALIEQVTVTQTNPPGGGSRSNGFGGLLVVVLRKVV